jgi:mannose-6-phosphate isomerase-like protein (cupin superfamily)
VTAKLTAGIEYGEATREYFSEERCHILELSNSEANHDMSLARARVEAGVRTKLHRVVGTTERYVMLEGTGRLYIEGIEGQKVGPGDVVTIPPGMPQAIENTGSCDLVFLCICTPRFQWINYESLE